MNTKRILPTRLLLGTLICLSTSDSGIVRAELPFVGVNAGAPIWNGSILFSDALAADIASAGCHTVRVNFRLDGNTYWTSAHLAKYDTIVQTAADHGLQILGLIAYEAVSGSQAEWNENYNTTGLNPYTYEFADAAYLLMNRYKDDIKVFELWNEPDCWSVPPESNPLQPGCFYIWPKNYANVLAETYKKCINAGGVDFFIVHGISLTTGGLFGHDIGGSFSTSRAYFTSVFDQSSVWNAFEAFAGRRYPWDYFGYHFYLNGGSAVSTSELASYFSDVRAMKSLYNDDTPFMVTEFGWTTQGVGLQLQADNLGDSYDWMRTQNDIASAYWYQWNDGDPNGDWGLVYSIGNPKPSYDEFAAQCAIRPLPTAEFDAVPVSGPAALAIQFTDLSTGEIDTWSWDFGDTQSSNDRHPVHTYLEAGTYTVSLSVTGPGGGDTETKVDLITVQEPTVPADLDEDGDVDIDDARRFLECVTGPNLVIVPQGCGTGSGTVAPVVAWDGASFLAGFSESLAGGDLVAGVTGVVEAGGEPPTSADPLNRALQVRHDFAGPTMVDRVHLFAANATDPGNGRVFQNYDVAFSVAGEPSFQTLVEHVTTGPFGRSNDLPDEPGDTDGQREELDSSVIKEIDVFEFTGPPPAGNVADLDGDGDADQADFGLLQRCLSGPGLPPDPDCGD